MLDQPEYIVGSPVIQSAYYLNNERIAYRKEAPFDLRHYGLDALLQVLNVSEVDKTLIRGYVDSLLDAFQKGFTITHSSDEDEEYEIPPNYRPYFEEGIFMINGRKVEIKKNRLTGEFTAQTDPKGARSDDRFHNPEIYGVILSLKDIADNMSNLYRPLLEHIRSSVESFHGIVGEEIKSLLTPESLFVVLHCENELRHQANENSPRR